MSTSRLRVKVQPGARRDQIVGFQNGVLRLRVTAPPERGKANEAVIRLLAQALDIPRRDVAIVRGQTSREKTLAIEGREAGEVSRRLACSAKDARDHLKHDDGHHGRQVEHTKAGDDPSKWLEDGLGDAKEGDDQTVVRVLRKPGKKHPREDSEGHDLQDDDDNPG